MFALGGSSRIFVLCPPRIATGGPESLHLFVDTLGQLGRDARMVYVPGIADPTPPEYAGYRVPVADTVDDAPPHVVIVPEIWTWRLPAFRHAQKAIWWLSVDNHLATESLFDFGAPEAGAVRHLVASAYAEAFVRARGATTIAHLSSYVHPRFAAPATKAARADRVLYNPKKGTAVVAALMAALPELEWRPLDGLGRDEVAELMAASKLYVDFGHHPGKERMPREAALAGCCVITGRKGSAAFDADVPLPAAFKLDDAEPLDDVRLQNIVAAVRRCIDDFATSQAALAPYREVVRGEQSGFERDVRRLFG